MFQMTQFTSSLMNLLQVATTDTDVAEMASRIHIVATDIPRPMTHDATNSVTVFALHSLSSRKKCRCSFDASICAAASGIERTLMLYDRLQLFSFTFSIVVFATRPSATAATRNSAQNAYAW